MDEGKNEHSCEILINSPPAHVFTILADLEQYLARWAKGPVAVKKLTDGSTTSGTRFEVTARVAGLPVRSPYTDTACECDRRFAGQGIAGPVRFSEEYRLQADQDAGDCTRLRYAMRAEPRGIFKLARKPIRRSAPPAARLRPRALQDARRDPPPSEAAP